MCFLKKSVWLLSDLATLAPLQVRVIGLRYGSWGLQKYGKKPVKVDALEFWPARLEHLQHEIKAEQPHAEDAVLSNAFVTFRWVRIQERVVDVWPIIILPAECSALL